MGATGSPISKSLYWWRKYQGYLNPQTVEGRGISPIKNQKGYFSGTECQIGLKSGCKFKGGFLEVYVKNINVDLEGTLEGFYLVRVP